MLKVKSAYKPSGPSGWSLAQLLHSMNQLGVFLLPPWIIGKLVLSRVTPSITFTTTHLYTRVERGTVRVKCLAQEHKTMSLTKAQNCTLNPEMKYRA